ncbi:hypothetical protein EV421DRAFT_1744356 [Armillaria borealis]|uniref:Uncharacterized protein n=1 Tax=Armillaria borealis TaxID=47425 RepID=A0AA39IWI1_9AGAR|nr:hypothetical protein EV421DRAFT_1744356 [Armillaria borealis]
MNTFYNKVKAAKLIKNLAKERQSQNPDAYFLSEVNLNKEWQKQFDFIQQLSPTECHALFSHDIGERNMANINSHPTCDESTLTLGGGSWRETLVKICGHLTNASERWKEEDHFHIEILLEMCQIDQDRLHKWRSMECMGFSNVTFEPKPLS